MPGFADCGSYDNGVLPTGGAPVRRRKPPAPQDAWYNQRRLHSTNDHLPPLERERGRAGSHTALLEGVKGQPAVVPTEEPSFPGQEPTA
jgi:hypothetical protein